MIDFSLENGRKSRCYQAFSDDRGRCKHYSSKITLSSSKSRNYIRDQKGILSQTIFMLSLPCLLSLRCVGMEEVPEVPDLSYTYAFAVSRNFNFFFFQFFRCCYSSNVCQNCFESLRNALKKIKISSWESNLCEKGECYIK